jgi:hypothetical protein
MTFLRLSNFSIVVACIQSNRTSSIRRFLTFFNFEMAEVSRGPSIPPIMPMFESRVALEKATYDKPCSLSDFPSLITTLPVIVCPCASSETW